MMSVLSRVRSGVVSRSGSIAFAALLLAGCTMEPTYHRPKAPVAGAYPAEPMAKPKKAGDVLQTPASDIGWEDFFVDPRLKALIAIAMRENRDLRVAVANIAQSAAII